MKILIIGLGSIGQRHVRNLRALYGNNIEIFAYRVRGLNHAYSNNLEIRNGVDLEEEYQIESFHDLPESLKKKPDIAFITNITSQHIPCALAAAEAGCDLFLEKPISHNMDGIKKLSEIVNEKKLIAFVGFQNRYHKCLKKIKMFLDEQLIGNLISVDVEMGERLSTMHPYEDYSTTYLAKKSMGGGVILNQQVHELDYIQWLFGKPESVYSVNGKNSRLNIDVEDTCSSIYIINKGNKKIPVYAHADFMQFPKTRRCKVIGEKGHIEVDLLKNTVSVFSEYRDPIKESYESIDRNEMFMDELKDFIESIKSRTQPAISLEDGIISLQMALAAKISAKSGTVKRIDTIKF